MDKEKVRKSRNRAVSISLDLDKDDSIIKTISRANGLFSVTTKKIFRLRSPDDLDPELNHDKAPWEQSLFLPHGSSDPIVARTIIQTLRLAEIFFPIGSEKFLAITDISWEIMNSLVSLRFIKSRLEKQIEDISETIANSLDVFTQGESPKPLPTVEYYDIEFRSFTNEVKRALNTISELFAPLAQQDFNGGKFEKAQKWAARSRGADSLLALMLANDQPWIKLWIDIRNAIEHPKKDKFVELLNFSLEANRNIRLPTWRFVHPDYNMARPQNLLIAYENCINNLLKFYEDLQIALTDGHLSAKFKIGIEIIPEEDRDKKIPLRFNFHPQIPPI